MESAARRSGGGVLEGFYRLVMRRTPVYVTFVIAGALLGERAVDYGVKTLWEKNNVGLNVEDGPTIACFTFLHKSDVLTILQMCRVKPNVGSVGMCTPAPMFQFPPPPLSLPPLPHFTSSTFCHKIQQLQLC
uniref:Complex III subunit 9 n=1 Tax=Solanum tuberosum TaxID=4113 RepID=M1CHS7_SOLTU